MQEQYFLVNVYARGLARDVKEQHFLVNVYARGLARDVKEQYFLVNVYVRGLAREVKEQNLVLPEMSKNSTFWSMFTVVSLKIRRDRFCCDNFKNE